MFPAGAIIICGLQSNCKGDLATSEFAFEDGVTIPCCKKCEEAFDTADKNV